MKRTLFAFAALILLSSCGGDGDDIDNEISVPVSVEEIVLSSIEQYTIATGTVNSVSDVTIKSENSGDYYLLKNPSTGKSFAYGDRVSKGQSIIRLVNEEDKNSIRIDSRKLHLETSKLDYEKQKSLYEKGGVTLTELKNSERTYMDARYDYENAIIQLAKLDITAPFDGIITDISYYTEGTKIDVGSPLLHLMDYSSLFLDVNLPGKDIGTVRTGFGVRIMNYSMPDDTLGGKVSQVAPTLDPETRSFKATILVDNPQLLLRPGMFVRAEIIVARHDSTIVIPKSVIQSKQRGKTVFIVEKGAAQERIIVTGLENPGEIEVLEGIKKDERLVIRGFETLRNRSKVKVIR